MSEEATKVLRILLTPSELKAAQDLAVKEGRSMKEFGRAAVQLAIARGSTR